MTKPEPCVRIDPTNPRIVYATLWEAYRNGHSMSSGGKGSGMYKSIDGVIEIAEQNQECQLESSGKWESQFLQ
jgi:hypothetical protein